MRLSRYVLSINGENTKILFNTINSCIIEIPSESFCDDTIRTEDFSQEDINYMQENLFFIEDTRAIEIFNRDVKNDVLTIILGITEKCNFQCKYCYENNIENREKVMSIDMVDKIYRYIESVLKKANYIDCVEFDIIGGEPLLEKKLLQYILIKMKDLKVRVDYLVETNGFLLDDDVRDMFANDNVTFHVPLTMKDDHNRMRPLVSGKPTYDIVVKNLIASKEFFNSDKHILAIRYNANNDNLEKADQFCCTIKELLQYDFVIDFAPTIKYEYNTDTLDINMEKYKKWNVEKYYKNLIGEKHNEKFEYNPQNCNGCIGYDEFSIKINPDGKLSVCNAWIGENNGGNIDELLNGDSKKSIFKKLLKNPVDEECLNCKYLFLCGGKKFCRRDNPCGFTDMDIEQYIRKYVERRVVDEEGKGD